MGFIYPVNFSDWTLLEQRLTGYFYHDSYQDFVLFCFISHTTEMIDSNYIYASWTIFDLV